MFVSLQGVIGKHPQRLGMAERRRSPRGEAGGLPHPVERSPARLQPSGRLGQPLDVESPIPWNQGQHRLTVDLEHQRLDYLACLASHCPGSIDSGLGPAGKGSDFPFDVQFFASVHETAGRSRQIGWI